MRSIVILANAGIQQYLKPLDSGSVIPDHGSGPGQASIQDRNDAAKVFLLFSTSSIATGSILSPENKAIGTGGQNAMRHVLLQAFTASRYGEQIAKQSADAHENNIRVDMEKTIFKDYDEADMAVDQRNNAIGRSIGLANEGKSRLDITKDAVDRFREEGFWIAYKTNSGYELRQVTLGKARYEGYKKALENKGENAKWIHASNGD